MMGWLDFFSGNEPVAVSKGDAVPPAWTKTKSNVKLPHGVGLLHKTEICRVCMKSRASMCFHGESGGTQEVTVYFPCGDVEFRQVQMPVILDVTKHTRPGHPDCPYVLEFVVLGDVNA